MMTDYFVDVVLPLPVTHPFTYHYEHPASPQAGMRVRVPFGKKKQYIGLIVEVRHTPPNIDGVCKDVLDVLDDTPVVFPQQMALWQWMADYYLCTQGEVYKAALPAALKREARRACNLPKKRKERPEKPLSEAQQTAYNDVIQAFQTKKVCLLHGVTSSGKTEIYTHLIRRELARGKQVLYLLPEIALTTQITDRLRRIFGNRLGIYHSKFPDSKRAALWRKQCSDQPYDIILGVRSALFLPYRDLGLILVDEEHETSYKQQAPAPRYNARDVAIVMASLYGANTLLGTATPSVDSYANVRMGKYALAELTIRFGDVCLPTIEIIDIKELRRQKLLKGVLAPALIEKIHRALAQGQQAILFQNRRGYAPVISCQACGWTPRCERCDVSLTYHRKQRQLICHYCGNHYDVPTVCPACGHTDLRDIGYGTEKIEEEVSRLFPEARLARMDLDTTRSQTAHKTILADFGIGRTDILIGTQMVTKGLDFDRVQVVGVLNADSLLAVPDFRCFERAFCMMAQVAGRAGRRAQQGEVVIQTAQPDLPLFRQVVQNDFRTMYDAQIEERRLFRYPPFTRLISIAVRHRNEAVVYEAANSLAAHLRQSFGERILGPDRPAVARVQSLYIRQILLKMERNASVHKVRVALLQASQALTSQALFHAVSISFDVDPL